MATFDVFNGDADGLCALHQLRLVFPQKSTLITGTKRDIQLLSRVRAGAGDRVVVLDISLDKNRAALLQLLEAGAHVLYFDHHYSGDIPRHPGLQAFINTARGVCTSILVNHHLNDAHRIWAVVAAFGDNLGEPARQLASPLALNEKQIDRLRHLGECLNYNAYGEKESDLHFRPAYLFEVLHAYPDPFTFIENEPAFVKLSDGYRDDLEAALNLKPDTVSAQYAVFLLPDAPWSRRVSGAFGNYLAERNPSRAHAILTRHGGGYTVSVRAPLVSHRGADVLCRRFESGGGRSAAAGINHLPEHLFTDFIGQFHEFFSPS
jgi:hypothetical protein